MRRALALALLATLGCRRDRRARLDVASLDDGSPAPPRGPLVGAAPVRAGEWSQPRWRYLSRGERPRGRERWRYDLAPREASGEPATDGRTVFVAARRLGPQDEVDGEVFAFDLLDGTLRWHTPVSGLHDEPLEYSQGVVLIDTTAHCASREDDPIALGARACRDARPGGVVGLDASTGRERFRTNASSGMLTARWSVVRTSRAWWMHDGTDALRGLSVPGGQAGARLSLAGTVLAVAAADADLLPLVERRHGTALSRRTPGVARPRWERAVPWRGHCAPILAGPMVVLPGFSARALSGAPRALALADGADRWTAPTPPRTVESCAAAESGTLWQIRDGALQGNALFDGRARAPRVLPAAPTSDLAALVDGVFYTSQPRALLGLDVASGASSVQLRTDARTVAGMVLWAGRGAVVTREPGLVIGFD